MKVNYFIPSKNSRLTQGHIAAEKLYDKILQHDGSTAYACFYDLEKSSLKYEAWLGEFDNDGKKVYKYFSQAEKLPDSSYVPEITFTQYEGKASPCLGLVSFDFDSESNIGESLSDVKKFVEYLAIDDVLIFFSGSKGFHLMVPFNYFGLEANEHLPKRLKHLAEFLKKNHYKTLDTSIYNYNRKFRVPFTAHEKTGLFKTFLRVSELELDVNAIKVKAKIRKVVDFLPLISPNNEREPLEALQIMLRESEKASYDVEKEKGGSLAAPTNFEKYDGKICIKRLLESRCEDVGRNNAALRIANDFYRTGKLRSICEDTLTRWARGNGLPLSEVETIITNIYSGNANYNFGCQDDVKASYCSAKCVIYKKLDYDKRPIVADMNEADFHKKKKPSEFDIVSKILTEVFLCNWNDKFKKFEGGIVIKQGKEDLFLYKENFWHHLKDEAMASIRIKFNALFEQTLTVRQIDAVWKMFLMYVPNKPAGVDMFTPKSNLANFNNGTLMLFENDDGTYNFKFREHRQEDFITTKIRLDYDDNLVEECPLFEEWLLGILDGDKEKFILIQEMYGASILPAFPQFFAIIGKSGSGKTTVIRVLQKLLGDDQNNFSKVPPHEFHGFNMSTMVGKLINIVTDIKTDVKINDDIVKQVEDRDLVRIARKNKEDLYAPLPALHIFGGNEMPVTNDSRSGAMGRRWKIINIDKVFTGEKNRRIAAFLFNREPQGILNFALRGLFRLAFQKGFFSECEKSTDAVNEWTAQEDRLQLFVQEITTEGIDFFGSKKKLGLGDLKIERTSLWELFSYWQQKSYGNNYSIGKTTFYRQFVLLGFALKKTDGIHYFTGIGVNDSLHRANISDNV